MRHRKLDPDGDRKNDDLLDLQWSEARWTAILDSARDAIISIDRSGRVTLFNRAAEQIFGYSAAEVVGRNVSLLMPSPYREEHDGYIQHYEETGEPRAIGRIRDVEGRRKDGVVFPIELSVSQAKLGDEVVYVAILRDVTERRRIEDDLRRERDFAERLIETAQGIVLVLDTKGRIMRFNAYTEELTGYPLEEVRGTDWFERFLPALERERARMLFLQTMHMRGYVSSLIGRDGTVREIEWHARTLRDGTGKVLGVLSIGVDITDRLQAARRLTAQYAVSRTLAEERSVGEATVRILQAICEGIGCAVGELWSLDERDNRLHRGGTWCAPDFDSRELEATSREIAFALGEGLPGAVWAAGKPAVIAELATDPRFGLRPFARAVGLRSGIAFPIRAGGRVLGVMTFFRSESGEPDAELLRMLDSLGNQIGAFVERTRADEAVRASEARFIAFMNNSPTIAFTKDEEGRYVYVNEPFQRTFHVPLGDALGKTDYDLWPSETARQLRANDQAVLAANRTVEMLESIPLPSGELHQWMSFKFPIRDAAGRRFLAGIAVDITDRLRGEAELREAQRLAQERERLADIGAITAKIAHDLGNPLGALSMQTQTMLRRAQRDAEAPVESMVPPLKHSLPRCAASKR